MSLLGELVTGDPSLFPVRIQLSLLNNPISIDAHMHLTRLLPGARWKRSVPMLCQRPPHEIEAIKKPKKQCLSIKKGMKDQQAMRSKAWDRTFSSVGSRGESRASKKRPIIRKAC